VECRCGCRQEVMSGRVWIHGHNGRKARLEFRDSEESRKKMSISHLGKTHTKETREKQRQANLGRTHTDKALEKMRGENNSMRRDPEAVSRYLRSRFKGPSEPEANMICICQENDLPFHYCDGRIAIGNRQVGYRYPDFIHETKEIVLEVYESTYKYSSGYRDEFWVRDTISHYKRFGYDCLCIDVATLLKEEVVEKLWLLT
jgi:hypothetical protein